MADDDKPVENGFELGGTFYRWSVSDGGKDLMLIDRFAKMPVTDFFELIEDSFDRGRAPVLLALIATSIRGRHTDWSPERIERLVMNTSLTDITFIDVDVEETQLPPAAGGAVPPAAERSVSPPSVPSPTSTLTEDSTYETFSATPA